MTQRKFTEKQLEEISGILIGCAIEVHRQLGPGLLESVYETCMMEELNAKGIHVINQVKIPVIYKGKALNKHFFIDLLIEDEIVVEVKSTDEIHPVFQAQLLSYLKMTGKRRGYLFNFNVPVMKDGIKRMMNGY